MRKTAKIQLRTVRTLEPEREKPGRSTQNISNEKMVQKRANLVKLENYCKINFYLQKIGFDTIESGPSKIWVTVNAGGTHVHRYNDARTDRTRASRRSNLASSARWHERCLAERRLSLVSWQKNVSKCCRCIRNNLRRSILVEIFF